MTNDALLNTLLTDIEEYRKYFVTDDKTQLIANLADCFLCEIANKVRRLVLDIERNEFEYRLQTEKKAFLEGFELCKQIRSTNNETE